MNKNQQPGQGDGQGGDEAPVRLRDALGAGPAAGLAGALAGAARAHRPSAAELADLRRALAAVLVDPATNPPANPAAPTATRRLPGAWRAGLTVAVLAVAGGVVWWSRRPPPAPPPAAAIAPTAPSSAAPALPVVAPDAPPPVAAASGPLSSASDQPPLDLSSRPVAPRHAGRRDDELHLLSSAQQALVARPAQAFALAERHRRSFPDGVLAQEREVIAIEALRRLHRADEAEARARRFRATYPHSAHLPRVEGQRL